MYRIFYMILSVPQNIVMDLNNVMLEDCLILCVYYAFLTLGNVYMDMVEDILVTSNHVW